MGATSSLALVAALAVIAAVVVVVMGQRNNNTPTPRSPAPFLGCGLLGDSVDVTEPAWRDYAANLKAANRTGMIPTWNWAVDTLAQGVGKLDASFRFYPNAQCGAVSAGTAISYPPPGKTLGSGAVVADLALGANEPDQAGYCQVYTKPAPLTSCDSFGMRKATPACQNCAPMGEGPQGAIYDVTGCGMWPVGSPECQAVPEKDRPFPFQCAGAGAKACEDAPGEDCCLPTCKASMVENFKQFYQGLADAGYTYASTPLVAGDISFSGDLLEAAGCAGLDASTAPKDRLRAGCPTHSAFHFYSTGCPTSPAAIENFQQKVQHSKALNKKYGLEGTIVNELGSLRGDDTACSTADIASMVGDLFSYLQSEEGQGVVKQMVWFNQDSVGGTFDLRLIKDGEKTAIGEAYLEGCAAWASQEAAGRS